jgi:hypothetical protein
MEVLPRPPLVLSKSVSFDITDRCPPDCEIEITGEVVSIQAGLLLWWLHLINSSRMLAVGLPWQLV